MITHNENIIDNINSKRISRRLQNELKELYKKNYEEVILHLDSITNTIILYTRVNINNKSNTLKFIIDYEYPFTCPKVYINGNRYNDYLRTKTSYESFHLKNTTGLDCFCCASITCQNNWTPITLICKIIDEIIYYRNIRRNFANKILIKYIKNKYLIQDIDIESWL